MIYFKYIIAISAAASVHIVLFGFYFSTPAAHRSAGEDEKTIPILEARMIEVLPVEIELPELPDVSNLEDQLQSIIEATIEPEPIPEPVEKPKSVSKPSKKPTPKPAPAKQPSAEKKVASQVSTQKAQAAQKPVQSSASKDEINRYAQAVQAKIARTRARRSGAPGRTTVKITIAPNGSISGLGIAKSSGNSSTDQAALSHIRRSAPFPSTPDGKSKTFNIPVKIQ